MRVHVLGGGIVGLACADELVARGHDVTAVDRRPGSGASYVAAGMLSPGGEAWFGEEVAFRLGVEATALWPAYAARLGVGLDARGTLLVARDAADAAALRRHLDLLDRLGHRAEEVAADVEPGLGRTSLVARLDERCVDPRAVVAALLGRLGGRVVANRPTEPPDAVVAATGARLPAPYDHLVRGVRGELVVLAPSRVPGHVVRARVGEEVYLVPRRDGRLVVGATSEEHDRPPVVTAGGLLRLLRAGRTLWPAVETAAVVETLAADRPATPDHLPLLGPAAPGVWLAAGAFRHGVLLAPLLARMLADQLEGAATVRALDPRRFMPDHDPDQEEERCR
ncbi:FAD-dependent oxidoreductase [Nocardioides daphniae]|uniref:FAD-dependent oxidoreductase n=1 Tax=Nocardioides daphniae TaxID=402297 RepID=UPI001930FB5C|nr:FAD-dependent oxidoreductase [Nocardioides daphniae]